MASRRSLSFWNIQVILTPYRCIGDSTCNYYFGAVSDIKSAFTLFDKDNSGFIDAAELKTVLQTLKQNPTDKEVDDMIAELDKNGILNCFNIDIIVHYHMIYNNVNV